MTHLSPVFCAIDTPDSAKAIALAAHLKGRVGGLKLGLEYIMSNGPQGIAPFKDLGMPLFIDVKLHDIPNTVAHALTVLSDLGADMMNVHAVGGKKMMAEAVKAVHEAAEAAGRPAPKLIAVTILTSMDDEQFADLNYKNTIAEQVISLAKLAKEAGMDGVVASPKEAAAIREACGPEFLIVTPGVRPAGSSLDDQKRVATPAGALQNGSSHIVVGRPITKAEARQAAALAIVEEIKGV